VAAPQKRRKPPLTARASAGAALIANVDAAVAQIRANARGAALGRDPEYLHQLRIGIRRLRSTLRAFCDLLQRRRASLLDKELRATLRALGPVRDWDVFLQSDFEPVLQRAARARRATAQRTARHVLTQTRFQALLRRVLEWTRGEPWRASADPGESLGTLGAKALERLYGAPRRAAAKIDWSDPEGRHRVRIRLKRLRYGGECFAAGFAPHATHRFNHRLRAMQHLLGELNDITVQQRLLQELGQGRDLARPAARARMRLAARERSLTGAIPKTWSKLESHPPHWRRAAAVRARG
jgi:CHAD domain-containing protein